MKPYYDVKIGQYQVELVLDGDGHLSVFISADSDVIVVNDDLGNDDEFAVRLSTKELEKDYLFKLE